MKLLALFPTITLLGFILPLLGKTAEFLNQTGATLA